ncbi:Acrylyl-CoA reductase AcuI [Zhongshania aliphaticivorans]|uniref:Acrylyl-CoA reductase AcuI n=1 Tax=Zhongshania aliphaticivorans TaxID=1470434 RepID=A0A5S9QW55_9GAMM|nr:MDR family oxidoreductase [Zhongshania aliphaticivorans]CAA0114716.1 Acrylyl-CoA reductase AcuI [Zhongshania aliphaticivorans]CAA0123000.1 Acrylyl-CoA reductase AcuI [Zhongshania aliphaticivorans]
MTETYKALVANRQNGKLAVGFEQLSATEIGEGDVEVAVEYSTLNYKDGLAMADAIPIVQKDKLILGIDMAGTVVRSESTRFKVGDKVVLNGYGASETHNGGYTQRLRTNSEYLVKLPAGISTRQAMAIGTAGYTAMLSVMRLESMGVVPESGVVLVTGASGGVGTVAISLLSALGYRVTASTGRMDEAAFLKGLGANDVINREELSEPGEMLQSTRWAAAVDSCGSHTLANVLSQLHYSGVVTACGLAQGLDLPSNMMPFALRNVSLLGVDSVHAPMPLREQAWSRLAKDLDMAKLEALTVNIPFEDLPAAAGKILQGQIRGRAVVEIVA